MATTRVGAVSFDVEADGGGFERDLRRIARTAGQQGGHMLATSFGQQVRKDLAKEESAFSRALKNFSSKFAGIFKNTKQVNGLSDAWKNLSHNTRQWTLIIGAVLSGMQSIAVLGSAAAAGLLVLGGAAAGALTGVGALVIAFQGLGGDLEKLPESIRPAAKAFQDLKTPLSELQDFLQERAFAGAERAFNSIGDSIRKLIPAFGPLGDAINGIINQFADWLASEEGIRLMTGLIKNSAPIFSKLATIVGKLGRALLIAFDNPAFQKAIDDMLTGIGGMIDEFSNFVASDQFGPWIETTSEIMGKLGELIGATSDMLGDLVTPEAIERLKTFIDNLTNFMPNLGKMLDILGRLDIFGILADMLSTFGDALEPLAEPLGRLADGFARIVGIAIDEWGDNLKGVADALAPFVDGLADLVNDISPQTVKNIADALFIFAAAATALKVANMFAVGTGLTAFFGSLKKGNGIVKSFNTTKLGSIVKGLGAFAALSAIQIIPDEFWDSLGGSDATKTIATWAAIGSVFGVVGTIIGTVVGHIISAVTDMEGTLNDVFAGAIPELFANMIPEEWKGSDNPIQRIAAAFKFFVEDTGTAFANLGTILSTTFATIGSFFNTIITELGNFGTDLTTGWNTFWGLLNNPNLWLGIGTAINLWLGVIRAYFTEKFAQISAAWSGFWGGLAALAQGVWNSILVLVNVWLQTIKLAIQNGLNGALAGWNSFWGSLPGVVSSAVGRVISLVNSLMSAVSRALSGISGLKSAGGTLGGNGGGGSGGGSFASGGILSGPRRILAGESGPEAIVPLRRNLSQVDPSVRWLAALAQGRTPAMANGGVVGGSGKQVVFGENSIVVRGALDPRRTAIDVANEVAERIGS